MCVTAILAGASLVLGAVGTYASISANNAQADQAAALERIKRKQMAEQAEMNRLEAARRELGRMNDFEQYRSSALAAIGASGLGDHISFFQGIAPAANDRLLDDVRAIRLNLTQQESQLRDGIMVSEYAADMARYNASMSNIGALAEFGGDVMNAFSFYSSYSTPAKKAA